LGSGYSGYGLSSERAKLASTASLRAKFHADWGPAVSNHWRNAAAITLIPIPIAWLVIYGVVWLVRWIGAGFRNSN
jgi:hypothetical protein